jgi:hypothetical protein
MPREFETKVRLEKVFEELPTERPILSFEKKMEDRTVLLMEVLDETERPTLLELALIKERVLLEEPAVKLRPA